MGVPPGKEPPQQAVWLQGWGRGSWGGPHGSPSGRGVASRQTASLWDHTGWPQTHKKGCPVPSQPYHLCLHFGPSCLHILFAGWGGPRAPDGCSSNAGHVTAPPCSSLAESGWCQGVSSLHLSPPASEQGVVGNIFHGSEHSPHAGIMVPLTRGRWAFPGGAGLWDWEWQAARASLIGRGQPGLGAPSQKAEGVVVRGLGSAPSPAGAPERTPARGWPGNSCAGAPGAEGAVTSPVPAALLHTWGVGAPGPGQGTASKAGRASRLQRKHKQRVRASTAGARAAAHDSKQPVPLSGW